MCMRADLDANRLSLCIRERWREGVCMRERVVGCMYEREGACMNWCMCKKGCMRGDLDSNRLPCIRDRVEGCVYGKCIHSITPLIVEGV